jgi:hypothetical protein
MMMRNYRTAKGTELPLLNLRGKEYLEVKYRLVWFREDHPDWSIETDLVNVTDVSAYAKATIRDENGRIIATSHKFESVQGFPDFIEKAETGAIGRALALIGYGTQFCADELDEGNRIVDAPVQAKPHYLNSSGNQNFKKENQPNLEVHGAEESRESIEALENAQPTEPLEYTISFGRKYKGKKLKDVPRSELENYIKWLESSAVRPGTTLSYQVENLKSAFKRAYETVPLAEASSH